MTNKALELKDIKKAYGACVVLDGATFSVAAGECVGLCGENGAGKTTLLKIIMGLVPPDAGSALVLGSKPTPKRSDVGMVHQHFSLVPALTVAENLWLGAEPLRYGMLDRRTAIEQTRTLAAKLGLEIDPTKTIETLTVGEKQRVELLKAFRSEAKLLLLDEPTAVLGPQDTHAFLALLRKLNDQGVAIVLVTHKLKEIAAVCTRAVVLRKGLVVGEGKPTLDALPALADAMVGGTHGHKALVSKVPRRAAAQDASRLSFKNVSTHALAEMTLAARHGEIIGIAGVEGNGQEALFRAIVGLDPIVSGEATLNGHAFISSPTWLREQGVRAIAGDRHVDAVLPFMSALDNVRLGHEAAPVTEMSQAMQRFDVRPLSPSLAIEAFSGGNQQKLMFAREVGLLPEPTLIVVNQPTRGIDFLARDLVWTALVALADRGATVIVISSDIDELRALSDRITVIYRGKLGPLHDAAALSDDRLGAEMAGT